MKKLLNWLPHQLLSWLQHKIGETLGIAVFSATFYTLGVFVLAELKAFKNNETLSGYFSNPLEFVSPIIIATLAALLIWVSISNIRTSRTMKQFGVRVFSKHFEEATRDKDWSLIKGDLEAANKERAQICILGSSGVDTFSGSNSPLHVSLQKQSGSICVLLLAPGSEGFNERVNGLSEDAESYKRDILDSIDYCIDLLQIHRRKIEVRLYSDMPVWKLIITNRALWVWHYERHKHVHITPLYGFEIAQDGGSLHNGFKSVFEKRWNHATTHRLDLKKWSRDKWQSIIIATSSDSTANLRTSPKRSQSKRPSAKR